MGRMNTSQCLTRGTVWLALSLYVAGEMVKTARRAGESGAVARWLSSVGCAAFLGHVASAFQFYHDWSHSAAYADTARQTAELFGWNWGGGIYFNDLFALLWIGDAAWAWAKPTGYHTRPTWTIWIVRTFFWFMILNGAVVFARGAVRGYGLILCLALVVCWWPFRKRISRPPDPSQPA
jgi:hypothetical protein